MNRAAAIAVLERARVALGLPLQHAERARVQAEYDCALAIVTGRHADPRLERLRELEEQLTHLKPAERARAICSAMRIGRTTYYQLRRSSPPMAGLL